MRRTHVLRDVRRGGLCGAVGASRRASKVRGGPPCRQPSPPRTPLSRVAAEGENVELVGQKSGRLMTCHGLVWLRVLTLLGRLRWAPTSRWAATGHVLGEDVGLFAEALRRALAGIPKGDATIQRQAWERMDRAIAAAALLSEAESFLGDGVHDRARTILDLESAVPLPPRDYLLAFSGPLREWLASVLEFALEEGGFRVERPA